MAYGPCVPDESVYTVAEFNALRKEMLGGAKEVQYADKRVVRRSITEIRDLLLMVEAAIWGHCPHFKGHRTIAITSKGIC